MSAITVSYNKEGTSFHPENDGQVYAKTTTLNSQTNYYVKKSRSGINASFLLNPYGMWHNEGSEGAFDKRSGRNAYELTKVTEDCFNFYLRFLQTKNAAYLRNAEREIQ